MSDWAKTQSVRASMLDTLVELADSDPKVTR